MAILFPAYAPTSWELSVPGYPVITNNWRTSEYPEILGSLPENAQLRLRYENIPDAQALELLLTWRATAGGAYSLDPLPLEVAAGVADPDLANQIIDVEPMVWAISSEPRQESVKAGRSTVEIELKTELRVELGVAPPAVSCPAWSPRALVGCVGGAGGVGPPPVKPLPPLPTGGGAPSFAPGQYFIFDASNVGIIYGVEALSQAGASFVHGGSNGFQAGLPYLWGYSLADVSVAATAWRKQFVEAGWSGYANVTFSPKKGLVHYSPQYGHCHYFMAWDGDGASVGTIANQRLYRVQIDPANGSIIAAHSWTRLINSVSEPATAFSIMNMQSVLVDSNGDTYVSAPLKTYNNLGGFGHACVFKINADNSVGWSLRISEVTDVTIRDAETELILATRSKLIKVSKASGTTVAGPYTYTGVTDGFSNTWDQPLHDSVVAPDGSFYFLTTGSGGASRIVKLDSSLQGVWSKRYLCSPGFGNYMERTPLAWDALNSRLLMLGDGASINGSTNRRPILLAIAADGTPVSSYELGAVTNYSPVFDGFLSAPFGGNFVGYTETTVLSFRADMSGSGDTVPIYPTGTASPGPIATGTLVSSETPTRASTTLGIAADTGNPYTLTATSVTVSDIAAVNMGKRWTYDP